MVSGCGYCLRVTDWGHSSEQVKKASGLHYHVQEKCSDRTIVCIYSDIVVGGLCIVLMGHIQWSGVAKQPRVIVAGDCRQTGGGLLR